MTYSNFISQFEILDNPPEKKGYHRHHIVPKSQQVVPDERQVYLLPSQHLWAHILYDREKGTKTSAILLSIYKKNPTTYEECIPFDDVSNSALQKVADSLKGRTQSEESNIKRSKTLMGKFINRTDCSKPVLQFTKDGVFMKEFPSIKEASRQTGINAGNITQCCKGNPQHKVAGKCIWKYKQITS